MSAQPGGLVEHGARRALIVMGIMLAVLLEIADTTIVNVALPTIQGNIGADFDEGSWIVTGYLISVVIALPLVPWFENILGRKIYVVTAILGFSAASVGCGISQSIDTLVAFRIVQGLFGGGIVTVARSILRDTFPPKLVALGQGLLAIGAVVGPSVGPTLGGILTDNFSWRWCFFINILPGVAAAIILLALLRNPPRVKVSSDVIGLALLISTLGPLQYVLQEGERNDWFGDPVITACTLISAASLLGFIIWELRWARDPIVDLRIFARPAIFTGSLLSFATGFTLFVGIILGPQFSQGILGFTATLSGNLVLVRAFSMLLFIPIAVVATMRFKVRPAVLIGVGFLLVAISSFQIAAATTTEAQFWTFGPGLALGGFGFGLIFVPLSTSVLATVNGPDTSKASSMLSLWQQLGASFSTAVLVTIIDHRAQFHQDRLAATVNLARATITSFLHAGSLQQLASIVQQQATTLAFADANMAGVYAGFGACAIALLLFRPRALANSADSSQ
jgi:DHA2 family multidrug resistance protein